MDKQKFSYTSGGWTHQYSFFGEWSENRKVKDALIKRASNSAPREILAYVHKEACSKYLLNKVENM